MMQEASLGKIGGRNVVGRENSKFRRPADEMGWPCSEKEKKADNRE